jgi:hypothetical protein
MPDCEHVKEFSAASNRWKLTYVEGSKAGVSWVGSNEPCPYCGKMMPHDELREKLAALSHEQWAGWTRHLLANLDEAHIAGWRRQIATPYADLSEEEKNSDRQEADRILVLVESGWYKHD